MVDIIKVKIPKPSNSLPNFFSKILRHQKMMSDVPDGNHVLRYGMGWACDMFQQLSVHSHATIFMHFVCLLGQMCHVNVLHRKYCMGW
jgi:hypothetical protein